MKLEFRAITKSHRMRDNAVMISSTMPSAKYSCSGSPLRFSNGNTAMEGLSGKAGAVVGDNFGAESSIGTAVRCASIFLTTGPTNR